MLDANKKCCMCFYICVWNMYIYIYKVCVYIYIVYIYISLYMRYVSFKCVCVCEFFPDVMCHHAKRWGGVFLREYPQQKKPGVNTLGGGLNIQ